MRVYAIRTLGRLCGVRRWRISVTRPSPTSQRRSCRTPVSSMVRGAGGTFRGRGGFLLRWFFGPRSRDSQVGLSGPEAAGFSGSAAQGESSESPGASGTPPAGASSAGRESPPLWWARHRQRGIPLRRRDQPVPPLQPAALLPPGRPVLRQQQLSARRACWRTL